MTTAMNGTNVRTEYCFGCGEHKPADQVATVHDEDDESGWVGDEYTLCVDCLGVDPKDL